MDQLSWYNNFASFYDIATFGDWFYKEARQTAIDKLQLQKSEKVFDIFCGTGINFSPLCSQMQNEGKIIGIDGSEEMLEKASTKNIKCNRKLIQADFLSQRGIDKVIGKIKKSNAKKYLFTLGLTCLPNWEEVFLKIYSHAPKGSVFSILDVYCEQVTLGAKFINWIGAANCQRPVWEVLKRHGENFSMVHTWPFKILDVSVFVANATKQS